MYTVHYTNTQGGKVVGKEKDQNQNKGDDGKKFNLCPENELLFISPSTPTGNQTVKHRRENEEVLPGVF